MNASISTATLAGFEIAGASLIGGRAVNMDAYQWAGSPDFLDDDPIIAAVADGLGSHFGSETISHAAVSVACQLAVFSQFRLSPPDLIDAARTEIPRLARHADLGHAHALREFAECAGERPPNTTLVTAVVSPSGFVQVGWIGDSRAYGRDRTGALELLTRDHNYAADGYPNALSRLLIHPEDRPEQADRPLRGGAPITEVLLCTDGVHGALDDSQINDLLLAASTARDAAVALTETAVKSAGATADNSTAIVIRIPTADLP